MNLPDTVSPSELLARFILQTGYYRPSNGTVKHNAFMPNKDGEVSVYRTTGLSSAKTYEIGKAHVANVLDKPLLGWADIVAEKVTEHDLRVEADPTPHPRHANIVGWPDDKSEKKMIAVELASDAQLHLIDNS